MGTNERKKWHLMMMREIFFCFFAVYFSFATFSRAFSLTNLSDWILAWPVDNIVHWTLPSHVIDADELEQGCIDEAHANAIPNIHGCQVGHDRQCTAETVRCCEEIQHCRYA